MKQVVLIIIFNFLLSQDCDDDYTYIPASEIPFTTTSLPFNPGPYTCFNDGDLQFLIDLELDIFITFVEFKKPPSSIIKSL